jgi:hypothetical protein
MDFIHHLGVIKTHFRSQFYVHLRVTGEQKPHVLSPRCEISSTRSPNRLGFCPPINRRDMQNQLPKRFGSLITPRWWIMPKEIISYVSHHYQKPSHFDNPVKLDHMIHFVHTVRSWTTHNMHAFNYSSHPNHVKTVKDNASGPKPSGHFIQNARIQILTQVILEHFLPWHLVQQQ